MIRLVGPIEEPVTTGWVLMPNAEPILVIPRKGAAETVAHELGHKGMGHLVSRYELDELQEFYRELMAWAYALQDAPIGEWDREFVEDSLRSYLKDAEASEKLSGEEVRDAKAIMNEILTKNKDKFR